MHSMLRIFALGIALVIFLPVIGFAQEPPPGPQDHLKCYKVKDSLKVNDDVKLFSSQFNLGEDCKIVGKERFFCGGVEKNDTGTFRDALDRICYRIECPPGQSRNEVPPDTEVEDQFGIRTLTKFNPHYLCTPAFKTGQDCNDRAVCGGECTDTEGRGAGICQQLAPGPQDCLCVSQEPCVDRGGSCGGPCTDPTTGLVGTCQDGGGDQPCSCRPDITEPCNIRADRASCGGACITASNQRGTCQQLAPGGPQDCLCVESVCDQDDQDLCNGEEKLCTQPDGSCELICTNILIGFTGDGDAVCLGTQCIPCQ